VWGVLDVGRAMTPDPQFAQVKFETYEDLRTLYQLARALIRRCDKLKNADQETVTRILGEPLIGLRAIVAAMESRK